MFEGFKVLFIEDDPPVRSSLTQTLELSGLEVQAFERAEAVLPHLSAGMPAIVITDVRLPGMDGLALLARVRAIDPDIPVVVVTAHGDISMAVRAMQAGAYDFIEKPFAPERFVDTAMRALDKRMLRVALDDLRSQLAQRHGIEAVLLGNSAVMAEVRRMVLRLAATSVDVLIFGETGTGKELVARCLHDHSKRRDRHFVAINCGGIPETLLDSELFGHEQGAFTSAAKRRIGKIEHANGGTLLLDEIESMPMLMQIKLLRILQERKIERLGSNEELPVNLRVVAATKFDLLAMSEQNKFRADLYYRLNVAVLKLPPLRERREDIPLLFQHFTQLASQRYELPAPELSPAQLGALMAHDWPGNVREIRNAADRFVLEAGEAVAVAGAGGLPLPVSLHEHMELVEKTLIEQAMRRCQGRIPEVMQALGIARKTLYDKLHRHGLDPDAFRSPGVAASST